MPSALQTTWSGHEDLDTKITEWLTWDINSETKNEIEQLVAEKKWSDLRNRLLNRLQFGTAGLRGCMRAGFDSMNDLVIVQTAQGLCEYIGQQYFKEKNRGIVLGYDGRYNSRRFAELSSCVFVQNGFKVYLYSRMVATPFVPFAIAQKKCLAGVMVTASHNPKEDNGYKVYWSNSAQIIPPHDKAIQYAILNNLEPKETSWHTDILCNNKLIEDPYDEMIELYYRKLVEMLPQKFMDTNEKSDLRFVYTAMHGVGYPYVEKAFSVANLHPKDRLVPVLEQKDPNPDFPTVKFPNPEEGKSALKLAMEKSDEVGVTVILANDPDADRLAVAVKDIKNGWKVFNGNELGALIGWWVVTNYKELHSNDIDLSDCYVLASTVSSKILRSIGQIDGFNFEETLTGFKWMANRSIELSNLGKQVLFAFEEAIGYMISTNVLDKDGVSAACHVATMASYLHAEKNMSLIEKLDQIYDVYGYHCTNCSYLFCYDKDMISKIFNRLRHFDNGKPNTYPKGILNNEFTIKNVRDLTTGLDTSQPDRRAQLPICANSEMITFTFENGLVITLRTSGTEPKIKYYAELCAQPEEKDRQKLRNILDRMVDAIVEEFLEPKVNNLTVKVD